MVAAAGTLRTRHETGGVCAGWWQMVRGSVMGLRRPAALPAQIPLLLLGWLNLLQGAPGGRKSCVLHNLYRPHSPFQCPNPAM
jgi:hypothetical protein